MSSKFFCNSLCEYFPCHKVKDPTKFNCLFCYCPLYLVKNCGGNYIMINNKIKDCSNCLLPHIPSYYDIMIKKIREHWFQ